MIDHVADHYPVGNNGKNPPGYSGDLSDFGKYNYPKIIAIYEKYGPDHERADTSNKRLGRYSKLPTFHFNLVGLPRILMRYPDAPGVQNNEKEFLRRVWERTDSYNAWTGEGTENHVNMSRTSGYLYAQIAKEKYPEAFPDADERLRQMRDWIFEYSRQMYENGTGEFNSTTYGAFNLIGWLNLYDFATDDEVKKAARAVLDYYAGEIALHYLKGLTGGSDMRGNGNVRSFDGATAYYGWLWFGDAPKPVIPKNLGSENDVIQAIHGATSDYRPPEPAVDLAKNRISIPAMYHNSKPGYLLSPKSWIKQTFYRGEQFNLGAGYIPYDGWGSGNFQIVSWKLLSAPSDTTGTSTVQYMSGIGMQSPDNKYFKYGNHRSPFDQLVHHENVLVQMTRVPKNVYTIKSTMRGIYNEWKNEWKEDFEQRFPSDEERDNPIKFQDLDISDNSSYLLLSDQGQWSQDVYNDNLVITLEKNFVVARPLSSEVSLMREVESGDVYTVEDDASKGSLCGWVIEVIDRSEYDGVDDLNLSIQERSSLNTSDIEDGHISYISVRGDTIEVHYQQSGQIRAPLYDWGYGPTTPHVSMRTPLFTGPDWPSGKGYGRLADWSVNGTRINIDPSTSWPVYNGPGFSVKNRVLEFESDSGCYRVDYQGAVPRFSTRCDDSTLN